MDFLDNEDEKVLVRSLINRVNENDPDLTNFIKEMVGDQLEENNEDN